MRSLRLQLVLGTAAGTAAVLLACGLVLYERIDRALRAEFDEALVARARSLTALAEQDGYELEFELTEFSLPEFEPSDRAEYYQIRLPDDTVLARSPSLGEAALDQPTVPAGKTVVRSVTLPDGRPGRVVGIGFVPRQEQPPGGQVQPVTLTLALGRDTLGLRHALARVGTILAGVGVVAVLLSAAVLAGVIRWSLRPVDRLTKQIACLGAPDLATRINASGMPAELAPVVDRLNDLLARLDAAFQRERRFTGDVAHELRTPLAGLRSKLELALSRERSPEAYRESISDCLEINLQMQRLVENLLHLARSDAGRPDQGQPERVDVAQLVRQCWEPLDQRARAREMHIEWHLDALATVMTDPHRLRLAVQNVLDNAVTYADERGTISLSTAAENGRVALAVSNTGSTLTPEAASQVFDRFWRADPSCRPGEETHCGLGLTLAKAVTEELGGSIEAQTGNGVFTIVIRLPVGTDT